MIAFLAQRLPLREVIGPLLLDVRLGVSAMTAMKFLGNRIFDFDSFDLLIECWECVTPRIDHCQSDRGLSMGGFVELTILVVV